MKGGNISSFLIYFGGILLIVISVLQVGECIGSEGELNSHVDSRGNLGVSQERDSEVSQNVVNRKKARFMIGSLSQQSCFAKVLCGLKIREPSTQTSFINDYAYLIGDLITDDDDENRLTSQIKTSATPSQLTKNVGQGQVGSVSNKPSLRNGYKPHHRTPSPSYNNYEDDRVEQLIDPEFIDWMAHANLAKEDPEFFQQVMKLGQQKRRVATIRPKPIAIGVGTDWGMGPKRRYRTSSQDDNNHSTRMDKISTEKFKEKLARQLTTAVKTNGTQGVGNSRQCRQIFGNQCPYDEAQMNEIVMNLKKLIDGEDVGAQPGANVFVNTTGNPTKKTVSSSLNNPGRMEIVLHLNQNLTMPSLQQAPASPNGGFGGLGGLGGFPMFYPPYGAFPFYQSQLQPQIQLQPQGQLQPQADLFQSPGQFQPGQRRPPGQPSQFQPQSGQLSPAQLQQAQFQMLQQLLNSSSFNPQNQPEEFLNSTAEVPVTEISPNGTNTTLISPEPLVNNSTTEASDLSITLEDDLAQTPTKEDRFDQLVDFLYGVGYLKMAMEKNAKNVTTTATNGTKTTQVGNKKPVPTTTIAPGVDESDGDDTEEETNDDEEEEEEEDDEEEDDKEEEDNASENEEDDEKEEELSDENVSEDDDSDEKKTLRIFKPKVLAKPLKTTKPMTTLPKDITKEFKSVSTLVKGTSTFYDYADEVSDKSKDKRNITSTMTKTPARSATATKVKVTSKSSEKTLEAQRKRVEAQKKRAEVQRKRVEAQKMRLDAQKKKAEAEKKKAEEEIKKVEAQKKTLEEEKAKAVAQKQRLEAQKKRIEALKKRKEAQNKRAEAIKRRKEAQKGKKVGTSRPEGVTNNNDNKKEEEKPERSKSKASVPKNGKKGTEAKGVTISPVTKFRTQTGNYNKKSSKVGSDRFRDDIENVRTIDVYLQMATNGTKNEPLKTKRKIIKSKTRGDSGESASSETKESQLFHFNGNKNGRIEPFSQSHETGRPPLRPISHTPLVYHRPLTKKPAYSSISEYLASKFRVSKFVIFP